MRISIFFENQPALHARIFDSETGRRFFELSRKNYKSSFPIFRDELKYTESYMQELCQQARKHLGWHWDEVDDFASGIGPSLHKNIETFLAQGFANIPEQYDHLLHELHYGLHLLQHGKSTKRGSWLQIEWYNDEGFPLDENFQFQSTMNKGDVKLQNPFVGHGPLQMYFENDYINISQTCRFHDFVKPGFNIAMTKFSGVDDINVLIDRFRQNDPEFVARHGVDKIKHYTGYPVVGRIENVSDIDIVYQSSILKLEKLEFSYD